MIVTVAKNKAVPIPDELLKDSTLSTGDILLCTVMKDNLSIKLEKFKDQNLSVEQVEAHGSLTRVEVLNPKCFESQ